MHTRLCNLLGIKQLIVIVNKMDSVNFSQPRFEEIRDEVRKMLAKIGYKTAKVPIIPVSSLRGDNLFDVSPRYALVQWI
eukprot:TRINITY_DN4616_c0_g1_i1.p1 TRINITY_DN4616_c0_g1~~TRINITY_DN4616_c0_g1_i1.p1  ORF type:complete len:79 (-),score=12.58 TRINITY_DN4616_c0_g1_i1:19-255(-)